MTDPASGGTCWLRVQGLSVTLNQTTSLPEPRVDIALTPKGQPAQAEFRFTVPLEDPTLRWFCWSHGRYKPFAPTAVGESVRVPAAITLPFSE